MKTLKLLQWLVPVFKSLHPAGPWLARLRTVYVGLSAVLFLLLTASAPAAQRQQLHGSVPSAMSRLHLQPLGDFAGTNRLNLAIGLPLRNQAALSNLLQQIYDPASPNYHHYLTPEQFTEQFGPTEKDYQAVIAFANAHGLTVTATHPNRVLVDVNGSVADIEQVMNIKIRTYQHPTENRTFFAPDTEPSLDLATPVLHISGLDNYSLPRPHLITKPLVKGQMAIPNSGSGSGPGGTYQGNDFRKAYAPDTTLTGAGQSVGLFEEDGFYASDITAYENQIGLTSGGPQIVVVPIDGGVSSPGPDNIEVALDIEMVVSMAPGVSEIIVYEAPNPSPWEDILNRMANDNLAKQLSTSWYRPGAGADPVADQIWQQMGAQGQSFFCASGDNDSYLGLIDFPGDSPWLTQVGGTTLTTTGPGGSYVSETVWNFGNGGIGSGGGISTQYPIPTWQQGINMTINQGSTTMRNIPDVALTADNIYITYGNGQTDDSGWGTSAAAPLWAGFTALVNQQAAATGKPPVGFLNPAIYAIGESSIYSTCFHDITTGSNACFDRWIGGIQYYDTSWTNFDAEPGYDLCTGWGTPAGQNLINALNNIPRPTVTQPQPTSQTVAPGGTATFTVVASGPGPFTYQWQHNGTDLNIITTVAGGGTAGLGDGGQAINSSLNWPQGVAVDANDNLFIADSGNYRVRKVDANSHIITTVAGNGTSGYYGDGGSPTSAELNFPASVAVDASGNDLFIADVLNQRIRKVDFTHNQISTVAGTGVSGYSGDNAPATSAEICEPFGVAVDAVGNNLFIADFCNHRVRKVALSGNNYITTVAGNGAGSELGDYGPAINAALSGPIGVAVDASGNLFIADYNECRIRKVTPNGIITTVAGNGSCGYSGDNVWATTTSLYAPTGVGVDASGNLFIADCFNSRIRKVDYDGIITTVAGTNSGGYSGDGGPATSANLNCPFSVAVDASGNLFIADYFNNRIREVAAGQPTLTLNNVTSADAGTYTVVVTSPYGVVTSLPATLTVADPPVTITITTPGYQLAGSWTCPPGVYQVKVECWGGGGGGYGTPNAYGGGGGGGAYSRVNVFQTVPGNSYSYSVGAMGGCYPGTAGGSTTFNGTTVVAVGGAPGAPGAGGQGGQAANCTGDVSYSGGSGSAGSYLAPYTNFGGAGGGAAGDSGNGGDSPGYAAGGVGGTNGGGGGGNGWVTDQGSVTGNATIGGIPGGGGAGAIFSSMPTRFCSVPGPGQILISY